MSERPLFDGDSIDLSVRFDPVELESDRLQKEADYYLELGYMCMRQADAVKQALLPRFAVGRFVSGMLNAKKVNSAHVYSKASIEFRQEAQDCSDVVSGAEQFLRRRQAR